MDHFEALVRTLLEAEGYWVRQSFRVNISKEEKRSIGKHSIPRPEIDLLALNFKRNEILALEAKSYLDSPGVRLSDLQVEHKVAEGRYKLFTSTKFREVVLGRLLAELQEAGMANAKTKLKIGLAAGHVYQGRSEAIRALMTTKGWFFWSPEDIKEKVTRLAEMGYTNDPAIITAKILLREFGHQGTPC